MKKDGTPPTYDYTGKKNESILYKILRDPVLIDSKSTSEMIKELWGKYTNFNDDRLISIVSALCVELLIDSIYCSFFPGSKKLLENSNFTFSLKIATLEALGIIPKKIFKSCNIIRKIRNEFAHNLNINNFYEIKDKHNFENDLIENYCKEEEKTDYKTYSKMIIFGLILYLPQVKLLRNYIDDDQFLKNMQNWYDDKSN